MSILLCRMTAVPITINANANRNQFIAPPVNAAEVFVIISLRQGDSALTLDCTPDCMIFFMANQQAASATMQIGEVAQRTSLTVDAIRFYERRKLLPKADRSAGRFRLYPQDAVDRLRFIQQMQGLGFSLREVGELIHLRERKVEACESVRELLTTKLADVRAKMRQLKRLERELESDFRKCSRELNHRRRHAACPCPVLEEATTVKQ
jgi:DNA-binding transcriptional MerR regulator